MLLQCGITISNLSLALSYFGNTSSILRMMRSAHCTAESGKVEVKAPKRSQSIRGSSNGSWRTRAGRYVLAYSLDDVKAPVETALKLD